MEWISVNDKLPDNGQPVLVVDETGDIWIMELEKDGKFRCPSEGWCMDATYWMPLPAPPVN